MRRRLFVGLVVIAAAVVVWALLLREPAVESRGVAAGVREGGAQVSGSRRLERPAVVVPPAVPGQLPAALFEGDVVTLEGDGIPGAELVFEYQGAAATVHADARGHFVFAAEPPGEWSLGAISAEGFAPFEPSWGESNVRLVATRGTRVEGLRFLLVRYRDLAGRVEDGQGRPIAGALVELPIVSDRGDEANVSWPRTSVTGAFVLRVPWDGQGRLVKASHPDFERVTKYATEADSLDGGLVLRLIHPAGYEQARLPYTISGFVLDELDAGVPGATLMARPAGGGGSDFPGGADETGRFSFRVDERGVWSVKAWSSEHTFGFAEVDVTSGVPVTIRVKREPRPPDAGTATLAGIVTTPLGAPLTAFTIWTNSIATTAEDEETTSPGRAEFGWRRRDFFTADGRFRLEEVPAGKSRVRAKAQGFREGGVLAVQLQRGGVATVALTLQPGSTVFGQVRDRATLKGLAGISVEARGYRAEPHSIYGRGNGVAATDGDGGFRLVGLVPGRTDIAVEDPLRRYRRRELSSVTVPENGALTLVVDLELKSSGDGPWGEYEGIGAVLESEPADAGPVIRGFRSGSGAESAGLRAGDVIAAVDGAPLAGLSQRDVTALVKGPEGTLVRLTVLRDGKSFEVTVVRRRISFPTREEE